MTQTEARATYEALLEAKGPAPSTFPLCTVNEYCGEVDMTGRFHGKGAVESCMGFTYAGDFRQGQADGQGITTWLDGYTAEGGFRDGIANGTSTLTWPNGDVYVGDVVNGIRHGGGTLTTHKGKATYDGSWARGKRAGWGRQCYADGSIYEGEWKDDLRDGHGTLTYACGDCYDGQWVAGQRNGAGAMGWKRGDARYQELYDGAWRAGTPHGLGKSTYIVYKDDKGPAAAGQGSSGAVATIQVDTTEALPSAFAPPSNAIVNAYHGEFVEGVREGWGSFFYADGSCYRGWWVGGKKNGEGQFTSAVGAAYHSNFADDVPVDMPSFAAVSSGPAVVPSFHIDDLLGIADQAPEAVAGKMASLLLRFNTILKHLFHVYAATEDGIAFAYTPPNWWRHRVPGHIGVPQVLRLLSDAGLVDGLVTVSTVLRCAVETVRAELAVATATRAPGEGTSIADEALLVRADGWLNYRQFTETLIRLALVVCVGDGSGGVCEKFDTLVETRLKAEFTVMPLCPLTRCHEVELQGVLPGLAALYDRLVEWESGAARDGVCFLRLRTLLGMLHPLLEEHGVALQDAIRVMAPFQRASSSSHLPPGFSVARNERQAALAQELYITGCGKESRAGASLLVSGVIVEQQLSLVDHVECIVALALALYQSAPSCFSISNFIETKILTLSLQ